MMFSGVEWSFHDIVYKGQNRYYWKDLWWKLISMGILNYECCIFLYKVFNEFDYYLIIDIDEW